MRQFHQFDLQQIIRPTLDCGPRPDMSTREAAELMSEHQVRRLSEGVKERG
jgi:hypothetical protein